MGRKKIEISSISEENKRRVTFNKRKFGVMKKAYELSVLCNCEIAMIIFSKSDKLYEYSSTNIDNILLKYTENSKPEESLTNKNIIEILNNKQMKKNNGYSSPNEYASNELSPETQEKYRATDEEFNVYTSQQLKKAERTVQMYNDNMNIENTDKNMLLQETIIKTNSLPHTTSEMEYPMSKLGMADGNESISGSTVSDMSLKNDKLISPQKRKHSHIPGPYYKLTKTQNDCGSNSTGSSYETIPFYGLQYMPNPQISSFPSFLPGGGPPLTPMDTTVIKTERDMSSRDYSYCDSPEGSD